MSKRLSIILIINIVALWVLGTMAIKTDEKMMGAIEALNQKQELSARVDGAISVTLQRSLIQGMERDNAIEDIVDELWLQPHIKVAQDATVFIDTGQWTGSGVIVSENWIATARHCVLGAKDFTVRFNDGRELYSDFVFYMEDYDIALIWVEIALFDPASLKSVESLKLGQKTFVIGSPYGDINFNCVTSGIISGLDRDWDKVDHYTGRNYGWEIGFTTDASVNPGNSGGPLFDMDGNVRGLLVGSYTSTCCIAMPVDLFLSDLEALAEVALNPDLPMPEGWLCLEDYEDEYYDEFENFNRICESI